MELVQGKPQSTALEPLIFNFYVTDLPKVLNDKSEIIQYADNCWFFAGRTDTSITLVNFKNNIRPVDFLNKHRVNLHAEKT